MNMTRAFAVVFLMFAFIENKAQTWQQTAAGIKAVTGNVNIEIQFYSPSIVRIVKTPVGKNFTKESLAVIAKPQKSVFKVTKDGGQLHLTSEKIQVQLDLTSGVT